MDLEHPAPEPPAAARAGGMAEAAAGRRAAWRELRRRMERSTEKHSPSSVHKRRHWVLFKTLLDLFGWALRVTRLYARGVRNARDLWLVRLDLGFEDLPGPFHGFTILTPSDLHLGALPEAMEAALGLASDIEADLCVLTGDYTWEIGGSFDHILPPMAELVSRLRTREGVYAVLGNHDSADMVDAFEGLGVSVLINESRSVEREGARIHLTGTDDVHYYYTDAARAALALAPDGFKIALIHSAELADAAADSGFRLYLAGHTHGGQVCLPGGRPIITQMSRHRSYASGLWRHGAMVGYTSRGVGVSGLPVRFNTRGEVALITLRAEQARS